MQGTLRLTLASATSRRCFTLCERREMIRTNQQIEIIDEISAHRRIIAFDETESPVWPDKVDITITTKGDDDHLFVYQINPFGVTEEAEYKLCRYEQFVGWESKTNSWHGSVPLIGKQNGGLTPKEESGDEPFDVAVNKIILEENKIKEIKGEKKMINFNSLYKEAYLDAFKDYVSENKEDLAMYADDTAKEKIIEHINDNVDFEDVAHNIIDEIIDYYIEYDGEADDDDLEQIICDYIFE